NRQIDDGRHGCSPPLKPTTPRSRAAHSSCQIRIAAKIRPSRGALLYKLAVALLLIFGAIVPRSPPVLPAPPRPAAAARLTRCIRCRAMAAALLGRWLSAGCSILQAACHRQPGGLRFL